MQLLSPPRTNLRCLISSTMILALVMLFPSLRARILCWASLQSLMRGGEKHKGGGRRPAAQADDIDAKVKQTLTHQEHALLQRETNKSKGSFKSKNAKGKTSNRTKTKQKDKYKDKHKRWKRQSITIFVRRLYSTCTSSLVLVTKVGTCLRISSQREKMSGSVVAD